MSDDEKLQESIGDDIFDFLPSPKSSVNLNSKRDAMLAREIARGDERRKYLDKLKVTWHPVRRVLYVYTSKCQHCGTVWQMPSERVLTEYLHEDESRSWARESHPVPNLPFETEALPGHNLERCPECLS